MRISSLYRHNLGLKVVSLVLAYATWVYVVGRSPGVRFVSAPVELIPPDGLAVVDYQPREVRVRLQGDAPQLARLSEQNVYGRVQIEPGIRVGRPQKVPVQEREVLGVPAGVSKEIVSPPLVVTLERRLTRVVPVRVKIAGKPPTGFTVARTFAEPLTVEISGPEDAIRGVDQVWTEAVDPQNHRRPFTAQPDLIKPDPLVNVKPDQVRVNVLVDEVPGHLDLDVPVEVAGEGFTPDPARIHVQLEGPPTLLQRVVGQVTAVADPGSIGGRGGVAPVRIVFEGLTPDETARIRVVLFDPVRVRLHR